MFTIGRDGDNFVLMTDCAETCGGLTKVTLTPEDARAMVEQARFLLSLGSGTGFELTRTLDPTREGGFRVVRDTERAPPPDPCILRPQETVISLAAQTFSNAADEARAADNAALKARVADAARTQELNAQERYALDQRKAATDAEREMRRIARGVSDE